MKMAIPAGKRFGRYEIRSLLGVGGMGEVYLAHDSQLRRSVALKLLPPEFTRDPERLRRFKREAFAASALNHPNIFTIYEIGQEGDTYFIATEHIEGVSVRRRIAQGPIPIEEILDLGAQIASALTAAHAAGIIHRDIKPDNIMIRLDGFIKVLDFGLAKLADQPGLRSDPEAATVQVVKTDPGKVMGTANYMSPEQTRGQELDQRTDIWSLGVILYELVAGRVPFSGSSASDVIASILTTEPVPLQRYSPEIPDELHRIVRKTLRKDPDERYQLAKELALDLKNLRRDLELNAELRHSRQPRDSINSNSITRDSVAELNSTVPSRHTDAIAPAGPASSAEYIVNELKKRPKMVASILGLFALAAIAVLVIVSYPWATATDTANVPANMRISRLTTTGTADKAAISPDGKYMVHAVTENGEQSLRVRQVNTSSDVQIVPPSDVQYTALTFSPDGDFIYYVATDRNGTVSNVYVIPALGGGARKVISNVGSSVALSPDGQQVAFIRNAPDVGEDVVLIAGINGANERKVSARKLPNFYRSISWSPDGRSLVCAAGTFVPTHNTYLVEIPIAGEREKQLGSHTWVLIGEIAWVSDGRGLIVSASNHDSASSDSHQLWYVSYPEGEPRRITNDLNNYTGVGVTSDGSRLVTIQSETASNIWMVPSGDWSRLTQLTTGSGRVDGRDGVAWTPAGQVVYSSRARGNMDLWIMDADGNNQRQLTADSRNNSNPTVTADGRYIVFSSDRAGTANIWRIDIDGSNPLRLTSGSGEKNPQCAPDGKSVIYTFLGAGKPTVWRVSIDGGAPQQLIQAHAAAPTISPDGKLIASFHRESQPNATTTLAIFNLQGGSPIRTFSMAAPVMSSGWPALRWAFDGRSLTYVVTDRGRSDLWMQPISGGPAKQLTSFKGEWIFAFDWSRDGKQLIFSRGVVTSDVVLLSNFR